MEALKIKDAIMDSQNTIALLLKELEPAAIDKANKLGEYEKKIALTILRLNNGQSIIFEGEKVENPKMTIIEKIAKGICFSEKIASELAEAKYKVLIVKLSAEQAILNGYQSINRVFSEV